MKKHLLFFSCLLLISFHTVTPPILRAQDNGTFIVVREKALRPTATKTVMPDFPAESKRHQAKGVAVAEFEVGAQGDVIKLTILQAPDDLTGKAVADAVRQWTFPPPLINNKPVRVVSKLTFYFVLEADGTGHVDNPRQFR